MTINDRTTCMTLWKEQTKASTDSTNVGELNSNFVECQHSPKIEADRLRF